jgi:hypothetical protein
MRGSGVRRGFGLALGLLAAASRAQGGEQVHTVLPGETIRDTAASYYGDPSWADSLALHNGIDPHAQIVAGREVRIPFADLHKVAEGDSWAALAQRYWGEPGQERELAELSGRVEAELEPGGLVLIPALIPHRIRPGESLAAVSRRLYGNPDRAEALGRLNRLDRPDALAIGQVVRIPVLARAPAGEGTSPAWDDEEAAPAAEPGLPPDVASTQAAPEAPQSAPPLALDARLVEAIAAYRAGRYADALGTLEALAQDPELRAPGDREALLRHMVYVYVAYERIDMACQSFAELRTLRPGFTWDAERISPKVIDRTLRCPP